MATAVSQLYDTEDGITITRNIKKAAIAAILKNSTHLPFLLPSL